MKQNVKQPAKFPAVGDYLPMVVKKGETEFAGEPLKNGTVFWTVCTETGGYMDVKTQSEADIIARLVRLERLLRQKTT